MRFTYLRVSGDDQSVEAQRLALGAADQEFADEGVSGAVKAADRPGFAAMLDKLREGDTVAFYAVDRLGRDAIDVQSTVRRLINSPKDPEHPGLGVTVDIHGIGVIGRGVGEIILAVLAQVADIERRRIKERCDAGRAAARKALKETNKTHRGKDSLGRPKAADANEVRQWRQRTSSSISATAARFGLSLATVKRYCAAAPAVVA